VCLYHMLVTTAIFNADLQAAEDTPSRR
jgi:hypothetical protein